MESTETTTGNPTSSRRRVLGGVVGTAGATGLAGCSGEDAGSTETTAGTGPGTQTPPAAGVSPQLGADGVFLIERDGEETVAVGPDGEVSRDPNPKVPLEACDGDGNTIWVAPGTYEYTDPPLEFETEAVSLAGPWSAEIRPADGQIPEDDPSRCLEIYGDRFSLQGLTFDFNVQNQGHKDTYGLLFSMDTRPEDCLVFGNRNFNAHGDAYGNPGPGTKIVGCYAEGFSEDGVHFKGECDEKPVLVSDSHFVGKHPFKIHHGNYDGYMGGFQASNCVFRGIDTPGVHMFGKKEHVEYRTVSFRGCRIESVGADGGLAGQAVRVAHGGPVRNLSFEGCTVRGGQSFAFLGSDATATNVSVRGGQIESENGHFLLQNTTGFEATDWREIGTPPGGTTTRIGDGATDTLIRSRAVAWNDVSDDGTRTTVGGVARNGTTDPRTGGDWNEAGQDGLVLTWDDGGTTRLAQYVDGAWVTIGTA